MNESAFLILGLPTPSLPQKLHTHKHKHKQQTHTDNTGSNKRKQELVVELAFVINKKNTHEPTWVVFFIQHNKIVKEQRKKNKNHV